MQLTGYIRLYYNDLLTEMSSVRKDADLSIRSLMIPLIVHLIALKDNVSPRDRRKYYYEIENFRTQIVDLNKRRGQPHKIWFNDNVLDGFFNNYMGSADHHYKQKYDVAPAALYSREDFPEFQWDQKYPVKGD